MGIKCAKKHGIKMRGIYIDGGKAADKPEELIGTRCQEWTWDNVKAFIEAL